MTYETLTVNQLAGRNIWRLRTAEERAWTQPELARRLQELTGEKRERKGKGAVDKWNTHRVSRSEWPPDNDPKVDYQRDIPLDDLIAFCRVFRVTMLEILTPHLSESVKAGGGQVLPADAFLWLVFRGDSPEAYFSELQTELSRLVVQRKFAGWVTAEGLMKTETFTQEEADIVASEAFSRWENPEVAAEIDSSDIPLEYRTYAIPITESGEEILGSARFHILQGSGSKRKDEEE